MAFPNFLQYDSMDCGPTVLRIVSKYYGKDFSLDKLRTITYIENFTNFAL